MESKKLKYCYLDGGTKDRQDVVRLFNRDHSIPVFLMSLKAGGAGLNLTGADMVIHFDPWWNPGGKSGNRSCASDWTEAHSLQR